MKELEKLKIEYMGYDNPQTSDEVLLEILGLELAVKRAEQRISFLKQSVKFAEMRARDKMEQEAKDKEEQTSEE